MRGIKFNELITGTRPITAANNSVIGLVATAPDAPAEIKSKLLTGVIGTNNAVTITSKLTGVAGDAISVALVNPGANNAALGVVVLGTAITVNLATSAGGAITTTATQLIAAIAGNAAANALVTAANTGASTGAGVVAAIPTAKLAGGRDEAFPLGKRTLVTDVRSAIAKAGTSGTLLPSLKAIADICNPIVVVVRVDVDEEDQDELVNAGIILLLGAKAEFGVHPKILGAPDLDSEDVAAQLALTARMFRARTYAKCHGNTYAEAQAYRQNFGARELTLIWPNWKNAFGGDAVARALALRARTTMEIGWHRSISNINVDGVTGIEKDLFFDISTPDNDVALLNEADIVTMIRNDGYRYWGNATCSDEPLFRFETTVLTAQALQDEIANGLLWAIDKPLTAVLIKDILETINARFRILVSQGKLIGARAWYDDALNPSVNSAAGKLVIDYDYTPCAPLDGLELNQRITDRYYVNMGDLIA